MSTPTLTTVVQDVRDACAARGHPVSESEARETVAELLAPVAARLGVSMNTAARYGDAPFVDACASRLVPAQPRPDAEEEEMPSPPFPAPDSPLLRSLTRAAMAAVPDGVAAHAWNVTVLHLVVHAWMEGHVEAEDSCPGCTPLAPSPVRAAAAWVDAATGAVHLPAQAPMPDADSLMLAIVVSQALDTVPVPLRPAALTPLLWAAVSAWACGHTAGHACAGCDSRGEPAPDSQVDLVRRAGGGGALLAAATLGVAHEFRAGGEPLQRHRT